MQDYWKIVDAVTKAAMEAARENEKFTQEPTGKWWVDRDKCRDAADRVRLAAMKAAVRIAK